MTARWWSSGALGGSAPGLALSLILVSGLPAPLEARSGEVGEAGGSATGASQESGIEAAGQILVTIEQKLPRRMPRAGSSAKVYGGSRAYKASPRSKRTAARLAKDYNLRLIDAWPIEALDVHCVAYEILSGRSAEEMVTLLEEDSRVEMAQPMGVFTVLARSYDDPYIDLQHGIRSMQIEQAHSWAQGKGVRVAVVDTGVDIHHPELAGRVVAAENFVEERSKSFATDVHGTAVAGVIASVAGNGIGIVGVAPQVEILALKACWPEAREAVAASCTSFSLAKALAFALRKHVHVLNMSLGGPPDPLLARLIRKAVESGMIVVSAVSGDPSLSFPSTLEGVIGVRSVEETEPESTPAEGVVAAALLAPGVDVLTTFPNGAFDFLSGSSLAAAHVAGVVALMLERKPRMAGDSVALLLRSTSTGAREVNACAALSKLVPGGSCPSVGAFQQVGRRVEPGR